MNRWLAKRVDVLSHPKSIREDADLLHVLLRTFVHRVA